MVPGGVPGGDRGCVYRGKELVVLRWGKISFVVTLEDTQRFVDALPAMTAAGFVDASLPPITD